MPPLPTAVFLAAVALLLACTGLAGVAAGVVVASALELRDMRRAGTHRHPTPTA